MCIFEYSRELSCLWDRTVGLKDSENLVTWAQVSLKFEQLD